MTLETLIATVTNKNNFINLLDYIIFCQQYLEFITTGLQAVIVAQNERNYRFFQYREDGNFNITRPINDNLMYNLETATIISKEFITIIRNLPDIPADDIKNRSIICQSIYTIQQSIGATLDALPSGKSNTARKINGDLFEKLIRLLIQELGLNCHSGVINVPVSVDEKTQLMMSYQHDLLIGHGEDIKVIGSVKTSSKDRIDKIFIDKFLYNKLTGNATPHIAIFLNDVQRKQTKNQNKYSINSTFLSGHFKIYTIKLNALDGVYYCDIRPNMIKDDFLNLYIKTIDCFFCDDLRNFIKN